MAGNLRSVKIYCNAIILMIYLTGSCTLAQQHSRKATIEVPYTWQYLIYEPPEYASDTIKDFPLLLFLHGGGESGSEIEHVKRHGPPKLIEKGMDFPFVILAPQNPHKTKFWEESALIGLLDEVLKKYRIDKKRIYLAGMSRGGYAAWRLAAQYPDRFAALLAISGETPSSYAQWLKDMPIWVFHGAEDKVIPVAESDKMVEQLHKNGNKARYTRYENTGHDAWTATFNNPEVYKWLLRQKKDSE